MNTGVFGKGQPDVVEVARIMEVDGASAKVRMEENSACESCGAHQICHPAMGLKPMLEIDNSIGAKVGDIVELEMSSSSRVTASLVVFGLPIVGLFIGAVVGNMQQGGQDTAVVGALAGLALGALLVRFVNNLVKKKVQFRPRAKKIVLTNTTLSGEQITATE